MCVDKTSEKRKKQVNVVNHNVIATALGDMQYVDKFLIRTKVFKGKFNMIPDRVAE